MDRTFGWISSCLKSGRKGIVPWISSVACSKVQNADEHKLLLIFESSWPPRKMILSQIDEFFLKIIYIYNNIFYKL